MSTFLHFDPRRAPVISVDDHLPKIARQFLDPLTLAQRFEKPHEWVPELVSEPRFVDRQPVRASVLVPIVVRDRPTVLLTERSVQLSNHAGQVAFPGGKADSNAETVIDTALREAHEEIGLASNFVQVLGVLPTYTTGSAFIVSPVVALVREGFKLTPDLREVADVFEVPLDFLMDPANHRRHAIESAGQYREWFSMSYTDAQAERFIWGATAGMIRNLYRFLLLEGA